MFSQLNYCPISSRGWIRTNSVGSAQRVSEALRFAICILCYEYRYRDWIRTSSEGCPCGFQRPAASPFAYSVISIFIPKNLLPSFAQLLLDRPHHHLRVQPLLLAHRLIVLNLFPIVLLSCYKLHIFLLPFCNHFLLSLLSIVHKKVYFFFLTHSFYFFHE